MTVFRLGFLYPLGTALLGFCLGMDSRREFLKKAALLAAGGSLSASQVAAIERAVAINPSPGTTYLDAEHVVILMQENRSFDHCYGTLRGVRGFNDPRAVNLPDGNPVWLQSNARGETYPPFRLNIKDTKATWMSALPHSWRDQTAARNDGKHDQWLPAKPSGRKDYAHLPLTMGYYNREDIPFYYALADAFTVCDQNFCSSLTGTTPNRLHLWTGTIREKPSIETKANVWNSDVDYGDEATWMTFPERLEDAGVVWKIYQNELSLKTGLTGPEDAWLANFTDNPIEWFSQYHVRFSASYRRELPAREKALTAQLAQLEGIANPTEAQKKKLNSTRSELEEVRQHLRTFTEEKFSQLPERAQNLHRKAFTTNEGDPDYRKLTSLTYRQGETERRMQIPKGDVLHQFRQDVRTGKLPSVSWIVAPENFSDHPGAPWYGAWYVSEVMDILTQDPEVWKKTIFILCYDENDGYFDHVPPFVPPDLQRPDTGKASAAIDTSIELVRRRVPDASSTSAGPGSTPTDPIGLGFRVPLLIASPWSRGGYVCSQVFDHTSILQLMEGWLSHKTGKTIRETNISAWRRAVCGDLSSAFRPYHGEKMELPRSVEREAFLGSIHQAQFKEIPAGFKALNSEECALVRKGGASASFMPRQEPGIRPACALPYELTVTGALTEDRQSFEIQFAAGKALFGSRASGAPFHLYAPTKWRQSGDSATQPSFEQCHTWAYAVVAGDTLSDRWRLDRFETGEYQLCVHGPNGFLREFKGSARDPRVEVRWQAAEEDRDGKSRGLLTLINHDANNATVTVRDMAYGGEPLTVRLGQGGTSGSVVKTVISLARSHGWYDLQVQIQDAARFEQRLAGHLENGFESFSDPLMGRV